MMLLRVDFCFVLVSNNRISKTSAHEEEKRADWMFLIWVTGQRENLSNTISYDISFEDFCCTEMQTELSVTNNKY